MDINNQTFLFMNIESLTHFTKNIQAVDSTLITTYYGEQILEKLNEISQLCIDVYREWPYLYEGNLEEQKQYIIDQYVKKKGSIATLAFQNGKVIGVSLGTFLSQAPERYKNHFPSDIDQSKIFYWGELIVNENYRHRGIGKELYTYMANCVIESHDFIAITFCTVERNSSFSLDYLKPDDYVGLDGLWKQLGFTKKEDLSFKGRWKLVGQETDSDHPMIFWWKALDS